MDTILERFAALDATGPKYRALAEVLRSQIEDGALTPGDKLPPVRDLAWTLKITPGTVARAYTLLTDEGRLSAEVGRGTFVAEPRTPVLDDVWSRKTQMASTREINLFSPHLPDVGQVRAIRQALGQIGAADPNRLLAYPTRDAYAPVRQAVVDWLRDVPLGSLAEEDVVLSHGGQNAVLLVMQAVLTGPRPVVLVEDLGYSGFRRAAETLRADVAGVEMDSQGIVPEALDATLRRTGAQLLCASPEVHNPTGILTPLSRRQEIARVLERHDAAILEDDCYRLGPSQAPCYRTLLPTRSWYVSSISKTLTPALRVGFAIAPKGQGAALRRMAEYGFFGLAQPLAELTEILLRQPDTRAFVQRVLETIQSYVKVAVNVLGSFDLRWGPHVPFIWLGLPPGWRAAGFTRAAEQRGIQLRSADEFALRDGRAPNAIRIAVNAQVTLARFEGAMETLRDLLSNPPEQISV